MAEVGVVVRDATAADAGVLVGLLEQLGYPASGDRIAERLHQLSVSSADRVFVAEVDGATAGLASMQIGLAIERDWPVAKLSALVVDERFRHRGVGQALVAAVEAEARRRGCGFVFLTSANRRADAHAFYRRLGYDETGRRFVKSL